MTFAFLAGAVGLDGVTGFEVTLKVAFTVLSLNIPFDLNETVAV